jgi:hypothetical protein
VNNLAAQKAEYRQRLGAAGVCASVVASLRAHSLNDVDFTEQVGTVEEYNMRLTYSTTLSHT